MEQFCEALLLLEQQFGCDVQMALATARDGQPSVRMVDGYYKDGSVYILTHTATHKMQEVTENPYVSICKDLFCACGTAENIGSPTAPENQELVNELKEVFCAFYDRHVNESDPGTCILKITLRQAVAFSGDTKYVIDFASKSAVSSPFVGDIVLV